MRIPLLLILAAIPAPCLAAAPTAHVDEDVAAQLAKGRQAVEAGKALEALSIAEALEKRDAAAAAYLAGLAFHRMAKDGMASGAGMVAIHFDDAVAQLSAAVDSAPTRFPDAYLKLAECAWYSQDLPRARAAAEKGVELNADDAHGWFWLGRVAFSQFSAASADSQRADEARQHLERAQAGFQRAVERYGDPTDPAPRTELAQVLWQLGNARVWAEKPAEADQAYARCLGYDPTQADFGALLGARGEEAFLAVLEQGHLQFARRYGKQTPGDAALLWWLGWARFRQKDHKGAEAALLEAVGKWPSYANAYYYVAHARFQQRDYEGAIAALREFSDRDREGLIAQLQQGGDADFAVLGFLTGNRAGQRPPRNVEAAWLSELRADVRPTDPNTWNDVGLFHRDAGDALRRERSEAKQRERQEHYAKSLAAYRKALELAPDDPAYLNDTAVVLHYCFEKDLDEARRMYLRATERAQEELARTDLDPQVREIYQIALRDSRDNLRRLDQLLRRRGGDAPSDGARDADGDRDDPKDGEGGIEGA